MKRILLVLALVVFACGAEGAVTRVLSAVATTGPSAAVDSGAARDVHVQVFSASTSSATVTIEQSVNGTVWYVVATITDPTSTGEAWRVSSTPYTRVNVTARSSGSITADIGVQR